MPHNVAKYLQVGKKCISRYLRTANSGGYERNFGNIPVSARPNNGLIQNAGSDDAELFLRGFKKLSSAALSVIQSNGNNKWM